MIIQIPINKIIYKFEHTILNYLIRYNVKFDLEIPNIIKLFNRSDLLSIKLQNEREFLIIHHPTLDWLFNESRSIFIILPTSENPDNIKVEIYYEFLTC